MQAGQGVGSATASAGVGSRSATAASTATGGDHGGHHAGELQPRDERLLRRGQQRRSAGHLPGDGGGLAEGVAGGLRGARPW